MKIRRFGRAVIAIVLLAGLVGAIPTALIIAVGSPLPSELPAARDMLSRLGDAGVSDAFIVKALAVVVWIAWAQLMACVVVEVVAVARGRHAARVPLGGALQPFARWLATCLLVASAAAPVRAAAAPLSTVLATAEPAVSVEVRPSPASPASEVDPLPERYTVIPGDNLWDIAEVYVDRAGVGTATDGTSRNERVAALVGETFELNRGREQSDGRWLRKPNLLRPGWVLELPDGGRVHVAAKNDEPVPEFELPAAMARGGEVASDEIPLAPDAGSDVPAAVTATTVTVTMPLRSAPPGTTLSEEARRPSAAPAGTGLLGVAGTALAVGVARALRCRRRAVMSTATPGQVIPSAAAELDDVRREIAVEDDGDRVHRVASAIREAAEHLVALKSPSRPRLVQARDGIEILLSGSATPAPPRWRDEGSGCVWSRPKPILEGPLTCPAPATLTLGCTADGATLFMDIETDGAISLVGEQTAVAAFARAAILELAHTPLAETLALLVVGDLSGLPTGLDRVETVESWGDVLETVAAWADQSRLALEAAGAPSAFHRRVVAGDIDAVSPLVVFATAPPSPDERETLARLPSPSAVTIVAVGWELQPVSTRIEVDNACLRVPALGVVCVPQRVESETAEAVGALLASASLPANDADPSDELPERPDAPEVEVVTPYEAPDYAVIVRVLGDITVEGGRRPLTPLQTAVAAYIALHSPTAAERVEDAVWTTPTANRRKRLANTVSECRKALGAQHFPVAADGRYSVGTRVVSDIQLLERALAEAKRQHGDAAIETLRSAVNLVRSQPFSYRSADRASFVWVDLENWAVTAELRVIEAALELGDRCLRRGDAETAVWAANRGLAASPAHAALTELLMRAHAAGGDRHAADRVYENHVNVLHALDLDEVAESTLDLHDELCARRPAGVS